MIKSGITKEELIGWGGAEVFNQALAICNAGDVTESAYDDDKVEIRGKIEQPSGWEMPVSFKLEAGGRIKSACPCEKNQRYGMVCPHVVALGIAVLVKEMDDVEEERAIPSRAASSQQPAASDSPAEELIEVEMTPRFSALVSGSRAALSIELDAQYGEIRVGVALEAARRLRLFLHDSRDFPGAGRQGHEAHDGDQDHQVFASQRHYHSSLCQSFLPRISPQATCNRRSATPRWT